MLFKENWKIFGLELTEISSGAFRWNDKNEGVTCENEIQKRDFARLFSGSALYGRSLYGVRVGKQDGNGCKYSLRMTKM